MYGIQTGLLGVWVYNEARLTNSIALRTEIGFDFGVWKSTFYIGAGYTYTFAKQAGYSKDKSEIKPNMHLRIGYTF